MFRAVGYLRGYYVCITPVQTSHKPQYRLQTGYACRFSNPLDWQAQRDQALKQQYQCAAADRQSSYTEDQSHGISEDRALMSKQPMLSSNVTF